MNIRYNTHNNHFEFGWGNGKYNFEDKTKPYWVRFGRAAYNPIGFKEECERSAKLISSNAIKPIVIFMSGGIDSEIVVRCFLKANCKFKIAIMELKYKDKENLNDYDNFYAYNFCKKHNIKPIKITVDIEEYFRTNFNEDFKNYPTNKIPILIQHRLIEKFPNHHCVYGGGDIKLIRKQYLGIEGTGLCILEGPLGVQAIEIAESVNSEVSDRFFYHTPESMLSWLQNEDVQHWIKYEHAFRSKFYGAINNHQLKAFVCYKLWPDMEIRPKYNGFEKFENLVLQDSDLSKTFNMLNEKHSERIGSQTVIIDYEKLYADLKFAEC